MAALATPTKISKYWGGRIQRLRLKAAHFRQEAGRHQMAFRFVQEAAAQALELISRAPRPNRQKRYIILHRLPVCHYPSDEEAYEPQPPVRAIRCYRGS